MIDLLADAYESVRETASLRRIDRLIAPLRATGTAVTADTGDMTGLPAAVDIAAYRILAECLTNAAKHAPRQPIRISVHIYDGAVRIAVANRLAEESAGTARAHRGYGLDSMSVRAHTLGGRIRTTVNDYGVNDYGVNDHGVNDHEFVVNAVLPLIATETITDSAVTTHRAHG